MAECLLLGSGDRSFDATAGVGDILKGKTAYAKGIKLTGSIETMAGQTITPQAETQTVSCGGKYMSGNITVSGANIFKRQNVSTTSSTATKLFYGDNGKNVRRYYCEIYPTGFTLITDVIWVDADGQLLGHMVSDTSMHVSENANDVWYFPVNSRSSQICTPTHILFPAWGSSVTAWVQLLGY